MEESEESLVFNCSESLASCPHFRKSYYEGGSEGWRNQKNSSFLLFSHL